MQSSPIDPTDPTAPTAPSGGQRPEPPASPTPDVPVLIVGGGVVGLSASLFLAQHEIPTLLVERHPGTSIHPRARGLNGRTMELLRGLGLEENVRKAGQSIAASMGFYSGTTLKQVLESRGDGGWLMRTLRARQLRGQGFSKQSPTSACRCTQDLLEPVLLEAARARQVDARFSTELRQATQDATAVTATLLDRQTNIETTVRAQYLIAADGARSPLRTQLAIPQSGAGTLTHQLNLYFRADLRALVTGREFSMCLVENKEVRGLFASINNTDLWVLHIPYDPNIGERPEDFPAPRCLHLIRAATGIPDLQIDLKGAMPWQSAVRVADTFQKGRIFLAGDAAHIMPPWGGFGANTGIQDAHNLAWKLSLVLKHQASPTLLETYDTERRPVGRAVAEIAGTMNAPNGLMTPKRGPAMLWKMRKVFPYLIVGYGYTSPAILNEPNNPPGPGTTDLKGRPGTRAPHIWLINQKTKISTLDLFKTTFVLLTGSQATKWHQAAQQLSNFPLQTYQIDIDLQDPTHHFHTRYGITPTGATLIRPDGIIAWRSKSHPQSDPKSELTKTLTHLLSLPTQ